MNKKLIDELVASLSEAKPSREFGVEATDMKAICEGAKSNVQPLKNVIWIVFLSLASFVFIVLYTISARKAKKEALFLPTSARVTCVELLDRVTKRNGVVQAHKFYYKIGYIYQVETSKYSGWGTCDSRPNEFINVYYDPQDPSQSVIEREDPKVLFIPMLIISVVSFCFICVNIFVLTKKLRKLRIIDSVIK